MNPRSEPLLWLQLVALGAIPLELLGLLLVLAGADPGPLPSLERVLVWAIGALGPAVVLWQRPADLCSLLLVQVPVRARSDAQRQLAALQGTLPARVGVVLGAAALLPLLWWVDQHAALAAPVAPLADSPRFVALLLACPLLAVMVWQWQQLIEATTALIRTPAALAACTPLSPAQLDSQRLCLGLPLLLLSPLQATPPAASGLTRETNPSPAPEPAPAPPSPIDPSAGSPSAVLPVAVEPEQAAEQPESSQLDEEIG